MDNQYTHETDQFGLGENAIHVLRNRFCYHTIYFKDIQSIVIRKGYEYKNWLFVLLIGLAMLVFVVYDTFRIVDYVNAEDVIYIERLLVPLFPFLLGVYSVFISFRKSMVMIIQGNSKHYYFSPRQVTRKNEYKSFITEIKKNFPSARVEDQ